jgi:2-oxoglutarate ferredoxin oxidoreductase subunit delta
MPSIKISREKCKGCLLCVSACPKKLISRGNELNLKGFSPVKFKDNSGCIGCAFCAIICPDCCIEVLNQGRF